MDMNGSDTLVEQGQGTGTFPTVDAYVNAPSELGRDEAEGARRATVLASKRPDWRLNNVRVAREAPAARGGQQRLGAGPSDESPAGDVASAQAEDSGQRVSAGSATQSPRRDDIVLPSAPQARDDNEAGTRASLPLNSGRQQASIPDPDRAPVEMARTQGEDTSGVSDGGRRINMQEEKEALRRLQRANVPDGIRPGVEAGPRRVSGPAFGPASGPASDAEVGRARQDQDRRPQENGNGGRQQSELTREQEDLEEFEAEGTLPEYATHDGFRRWG